MIMMVRTKLEFNAFIMRFTSQLLVLWIISTMQHVRSQKETSKEAGETNAGKTSCKRTKWTAQMNADLIDSRKEADALYSSQDCPRNESGRKIGIMELTKRLWDAKGYAWKKSRKTTQTRLT